MFVSPYLLSNDGNTPYCPFHIPSNDCSQSSFEGVPKPGICIRVSANETGPRIAFPQGNGIYFAACLFGMAPDTMPFPCKAAGPCVFLLICVALCFGAWIQTLTPNYILGASSKSHCRLRKERGDFFLEHKLSGSPKICISFAECWNGSSFSIFSFYCLPNPSSLRMVLFFKSHIPKRNSHTYRHWGWTPQYPIRFRQSNLSEPEENEMDWEKALRSCKGTVFTPSLRKALSMPADFYTTFSSPQMLSCFEKTFAVLFQRGNCRSDKPDAWNGASRLHSVPRKSNSKG